MYLVKSNDQQDFSNSRKNAYNLAWHGRLIKSNFRACLDEYFFFKYLFIERKNKMRSNPFYKVRKAYFNHLSRAIFARSALLEKLNALFSTKNSKNTSRLVECTVLNTLNLEK